MRTLKQIIDYWRKPSDGMNMPEGYLQPNERSIYLFIQIENYINEKDKILEIGCNVMRNLNVLYENGYKNLYAIEVSWDAFKIAEKCYPELYKNVIKYNFPVEHTIDVFTDNSIDVIFSMAVFQHIHPDSDWVFEKIAKITGKYLITIECEKKIKSWRHFPRKYKNIFEGFGLKQIKVKRCPKGIGLDKYKLRIFKK